MSDTLSRGAGHFMVGSSPYPLQLQIWDNIQVHKSFLIRLVWFEHLCITPRKQGSNLFSDAASAAVSEQLSLHCTGAFAPTPYLSPGVNKKQKNQNCLSGIWAILFKLSASVNLANLILFTCSQSPEFLSIK